MNLIESKLKQAIKNKFLVNFRYDNEDTFRVFAPYIIYKYNNSILVTGTQFRDYKKSVRDLVPRIFKLNKINSLRISAIKFEYDNRFDKNRKQYKNSIVVIKP